MENIIIGDQVNFENIIKSDKLTIVDLWAKWCGPCRTLLPILEDFASKNIDIQLVKIDVDQNTDLATRLGVRSIPTLIFFKNGEEKKRVVGLLKTQDLDKLKEELK